MFHFKLILLDHNTKIQMYKSMYYSQYFNYDYFLCIFLLLQASHKAKALSKGKLAKVAGLTDIERMYRDELDPLLIPRVSGEPGNRQAREVRTLSLSGREGLGTRYFTYTKSIG